MGVPQKSRSFRPGLLTKEGGSIPRLLDEVIADIYDLSREGHDLLLHRAAFLLDLVFRQLVEVDPRSSPGDVEAEGDGCRIGFFAPVIQDDAVEVDALQDDFVLLAVVGHGRDVCVHGGLLSVVSLFGVLQLWLREADRTK